MTAPQILAFPCGASIDEKTADKYLDAARSAKTIQNYVHTKAGTLTKRLGYTALALGLVIPGANGNILNGSKLAAYKNELLEIDGSYLYSYGAAGPTVRDHVSNCVATRQSIAQATAAFSDGDVAEGSGHRVFCWTAAVAGSLGDIFVSLLDTATGAYVQSSVALTTGAIYARSHAMVLNGIAIVTYQDTVSGIWATTLNLANIAAGWSAAAKLTNVLGNGKTYDVCPIVGDATHWILAYENAGGANSVTLVRYTNALAAGASANVVEPNVGMTAIGVRATLGEVLWVGYSYFAGGAAFTKAACYNPTTLALVSAPTLIYTSGAAGQTAYSIGFERFRNNSLAVMTIQPVNGGLIWAVLNTIIGIQAGPRFAQDFSAQSRPFSVGTGVPARCFVFGAYGGASQGTQALVDLMADDWGVTPFQPRVVARVAPRYSYPLRSFATLAGVTNPGIPTSTAFNTVGSIAMTASVNGRLGLVQVTLDFAHPALWLNVELGESLYIAGGAPQTYDGTLAVEIGFETYPDAGLVAQTPNTIGGGLANKIYEYVFLYEWVDTKGQRHQSAPSTPVVVDFTASATGTNKVDFLIPCLHLTARQEDDIAISSHAVGIVPYRTVVTAGTAGTVFYRMVPDDIPSALLNDPNAATVAWTDLGTAAQADAVVATHPLVYTTGGIKPTVCPSSLTAMCAHKSRLVAAGDDGKTLWFTTQYVIGEPVRFIDDFTFAVDDGGAITALASLDEKLIIFKRDRIFLIDGDYPPETNIGGNLSLPVRIPSDVGCIDPRSVVLVPQGLLFQSVAGIYLLDRALQVQFLGIPIQDTLVTYPTITSAVLCADKNLVRFTANSATHGIGIWFDFVQGKWTTQLFADAVSAATQPLIASAVVANGLYCWVNQSNGRVHQEKTVASAYAYIDGDNVSYAVGTFESAWVKIGQLEGYLRARVARILADVGDQHDLTLELAYDYNPAYVEGRTWEWPEIAPLRREELEKHVGALYTRAHAVRMRITDVAPTDGFITTGKGPVLNEYAFTCASRGTLYKPLAAAAKG